MLCDVERSSQGLLEPHTGAEQPLTPRGGFPILPSPSPALLSAPRPRGCRNAAVTLHSVTASPREGHPSPFLSSGAAEPQPAAGWGGFPAPADVQPRRGSRGQPGQTIKHRVPRIYGAAAPRSTGKGEFRGCRTSWKWLWEVVTRSLSTGFVLLDIYC